MIPPDRARQVGRAAVAVRAGRPVPRLLLAALLLAHPLVLPAADEGRIDDVRMQVVEDPDADERDYVDRIELPEAAASEGRDNAGRGVERADEARERGRGTGRERAREARELGGDARRPDEPPGRGGDGPPGGPPEDKPGNQP